MADDILAFGLQMMEAIQVSQQQGFGGDDHEASSMESRMESLDSDVAAVLRVYLADVIKWQQEEADRRLAELEQRRESRRLRQLDHDRRLAEDLHRHWNVLGDTHYEPLPVEFDDVGYGGEYAPPVGENMPPVPAADVTEVCTICAEDRFPSEMVTVSGCDHRFCVHCVERHAAVKVTQGEVNIRCPAVNCAVSFSDEECGRLLSEKTLEMLAKRVKDLSIPAEYKVYCPYKDCSEMMDRRELEVSESTSSSSSASASARACVTCSRCENKMRSNVAWHVDMSCDTFQALPTCVTWRARCCTRWQKESTQCERCGRIIERDGGCEHIKCKCDYEFCYMCGKKWIRANHSCVRAFN